MTTLPLTPTHSRTCGRNSCKSLKNDDFTKKGGGGTPTPLSDVIQPPAPLQPHAVEQTVQGEIAGVNVRGIVDLLDTDGRVLDLKTASKRPNGLSAEHSLQLTTYAMITPGASGLCRLDSVTKTKTVQVIQQSYQVGAEDRRFVEALHPMVQAPDISCPVMPFEGKGSGQSIRLAGPLWILNLSAVRNQGLGRCASPFHSIGWVQ
jgi:hypothetical protein